MVRLTALKARVKTGEVKQKTMKSLTGMILTPTKHKRVTVTSMKEQAMAQIHEPIGAFVLPFVQW